MRYRATLIGGALVAAMALPVAAEAHKSVTPKTVAKHIRSADQALDMVETLVERNSDAKAAVQLAKLRRQVRAADRESAKLRGRARSRRAKARSASVTLKVAGRHNDTAEVLAAIVDETSGQLQFDIAGMIDSALRGREKAISVLTKLMDRLPESAKPGVARAIARLSSDGADEVRFLTEALEGGTLSPEVRAQLEDALQCATEAVDMAIERLGSLAELAPEEARPYVEEAVVWATTQLNMVRGLLQELFTEDGVPAGGTPPGGGSLPLPSGLPLLSGALCNLPFELPFSLPGC